MATFRSYFKTCHQYTTQRCNDLILQDRGKQTTRPPKVSIETTLRRDLKSHNSDHWPTRLHSIKDLDHPRDIAQNRSDWKHRMTAMYRSAQAETSVDVAADGH
ncbi:hypothetical protein ElyMa_001581000 [Elysia marginata]|uniref:Uncharacterized protein n=1 Tax=Elysia marginata TaxID=1093978 RepID=A0AAV4JFN1_9GAST|nr:hypothetical protein ElyMa_001581000 [Elysia marginata]